MTNRLYPLYELSSFFSTDTHSNICADYCRKPKALACLFCEAFDAQTPFDNTAQPFVDSRALSQRKPISSSSKGTARVLSLLVGGGNVELSNGDYSFEVTNREVPPLRSAKCGKPRSAAGGIDYVGNSKGGRPILGEIKYKSDKNSFFAFVQLLAYLSLMATDHQICRAKKYGLFGADLKNPARFDLHILLADFNDRGKKGPLIDKTKRLAGRFLDELHAMSHPAAKRIGTILCLKMHTVRYHGKLDIAWRVE